MSIHNKHCKKTKNKKEFINLIKDIIKNPIANIILSDEMLSSEDQEKHKYPILTYLFKLFQKS